MSLFCQNVVLALAPPTQPGQQQPPFWTTLVPLALLGVVFYFALIRPQQKKQREQADMLKTVRKGDKVITSGGIVSEVVTVKDKTLVVRSMDAKFEINKSAIAEITERSSESAQS